MCTSAKSSTDILLCSCGILCALANGKHTPPFFIWRKQSSGLYRFDDPDVLFTFVKGFQITLVSRFHKIGRLSRQIKLSSRGQEFLLSYISHNATLNGSLLHWEALVFLSILLYLTFGLTQVSLMGPPTSGRERQQ